jgi:Spy/CpxP family protein refolding chaperone
MERNHVMSNPLKTAAVGALLALGLASASAGYAEQSPSGDSGDSRMGTGVRHGGMTGMQGGTMGMGSMMGQTGGMMDGSSGKMQGDQPPNSQFHPPPQSPQQE